MENFSTFVKSNDGTSIALTKIGSGPVLILIDGALCHRNFGPNKALAELLKSKFTVITYDRRGRGESGDTQPYTIQKEIEDLDAIIQHVGHPVDVYGISSGAALALEAANAGLPINKVAVYEAPFIVDDTRKPVPNDYFDNLQSFDQRGQKGKVVSYFMQKGIGLPGFVVFMMKCMPVWKKMKGIAHTILYDTSILGDKLFGKPLSKRHWSGINSKVLVIAGSKSPLWTQNAMKQLSSVLSDAQHKSLKGQNHMVKPESLSPMLVNFFTS